MNQSVLEQFSRDPKNWRFHFIYFCPRDPRIVVPKRYRGFGWTLNFARPLALPFLASLLTLCYSILSLANALTVGRDARYALKILMVLGLIALCNRLSKARTVR